MRQQLKWLLFPGLNLHARERNRELPRYFTRPGADGQPKNVLDAGCGNGMLSYQSYKLGNRVLGLSIKEGEVTRNSALFHDHLGCDRDRMRFQVQNLYKLEELADQGPFDEIICTEVLEHIKGDRQVVDGFFELLAPGGSLLVTTPNAEHPWHASFPLDEDETGGHVRPGYTPQSYRELFEPAGFEVVEISGLGGPVRQAVNNRIIRGEEAFGLSAAMAVFALGGPLMMFDRGASKTPYSLLARLRKPAASDAPETVDASTDLQAASDAPVGVAVSSS